MLRTCNYPVFLFILLFVGVSVGHASNQSLSSIVGFYPGQIESIEMVVVETEFFFDLSGSVVGRYRYQDQGSWDETGKLFNLRIVTRGGCGTNQPTTVAAERGEPAGESDSVLGRALLGAMGKKKGSKSTQVRVSDGQGELCLSGIWQDRYGQGPVEFRFNPTRDYFSGYYWSLGEEKAVWNGTNIPSGQQVTQINKGTVANDNSAGGAKLVAATEGEKYFERFEETGVGNTKEYAIKEAYFFAVQRKLTSLAGYQAEGDIGRWFRESHTRDFDSFKQRYFTPNTQEKSCFVKAGGKHECTIEGSLKLAALKTDLRKIVKTKERVLSDSLVFFLSSADAVDAAAKQGTEVHARYFVDQLEGVFVRRGHRIVFGEKAKQAIADGEVDYGLSVREISFIDIRKGLQYTSGALRVAFRLTHLESSTTLANIPITQVAEVAGDIEATLVAELSKQVSAKIALSVTESVISYQGENDENARAKKQVIPGQQTYFLRLVGLQQRNRKELRDLRESIKGMFPDSTPTTDPDQSDATQVTMLFSTAKEVDHDGLLDYFYGTYEDLAGFDAEYLGNNEYLLYFRISAPVPASVAQEDEESSKKPSDSASSKQNEPGRD
jgi:hypothetical protein